MKFEKIHRLIRDIKLSLQHSCGGVLLKAQVYSSNLWNYHNKPFGSGHFGVAMQRAMHVFGARNGGHSPRFQKYLPRIYKELGRPRTTLEEQERILAYCCDLPNITKRSQMSWSLSLTLLTLTLTLASVTLTLVLILLTLTLLKLTLSDSKMSQTS